MLVKLELLLERIENKIGVFFIGLILLLGSVPTYIAIEYVERHR